MALAINHVICQKICFSLKNPWNLNISILVKEQILCKHMFYTYIPNFMQIFIGCRVIALERFWSKDDKVTVKHKLK